MDRLAWYKTPSGGFHAYFRTSVSHPNIGLAFNEKREKIIEVKCDGGYVLAPGMQSYGEYKHVGGTTVENLCTLTVAETEMLLEAAKSLDRRGAVTGHTAARQRHLRPVPYRGHQERANPRRGANPGIRRASGKIAGGRTRSGRIGLLLQIGSRRALGLRLPRAGRH